MKKLSNLLLGLLYTFGNSTFDFKSTEKYAFYEIGKLFYGVDYNVVIRLTFCLADRLVSDILV